jgi:hypothetical protein
MKRRSKLAKENDITAEEEEEIKKAWSMFSQEDVEDYKDEKEGVLKTGDIMVALRYAIVSVMLDSLF